MAGTIERVVSRLGTSTSLSAMTTPLIPGEMGWLTDLKQFIVGDDTLSPPVVPTSKSTGSIAFLSSLTVKYGRIDMYDGGEVDGVDISTMNQAPGVPVRVDDGIFKNALIVGDGVYTLVENMDLSATLTNDTDPQQIIVTLTDEFKNGLGGTAGGANRFTFGPDFPVGDEVKPGDFHYLESDELVYIRCRQTQGLYDFWLDIGSGGGSGNGNKVWFRETAPDEALIGDDWYDTTTFRLYTRLIQETNVFWVERQI